MKTTFTLGTKELELYRYPKSLQHPSWQAWDATDEYLLTHTESLGLSKDSKIHILNDDFGALACGLNEFSVFWQSDSLVAQKACRQNLSLNNLNQDNTVFLNSLDELPSSVDLVVLKIPKSLTLLEYQLWQIQQHPKPLKVVAGGKVKTVTKSVMTLFERYLNNTKSSLAVKKSRLIFTESEGCSDSNSPNNPFIKTWTLENSDLLIHNHANVFSRNQLDIGGRFLLENLPNADNLSVADLGCGNGVLGLKTLMTSTPSKMHFIDESYMAVASAQKNVEFNLPEQLNKCHFSQSNCLEDIKNERFDLVLCNPPFHQQNAITDHIAWQMFVDSKASLNTGGELRIVANRHLDYHQKLKRLFGGYKVVASNKKFSILSTYKK